MDVLGFQCLSLGSSRVQLHDSLSSRCACACSEAGFSSQNVDMLEYTVKEQDSIMHFSMGKWTQYKEY
jgi:hypothetical protein